MQKITKQNIRKEATNDTVYSRGLRYYKNKAITNVTWSNSNKQYRAIVKGSSNYIVTVEIQKDHSVHYNCNCPAYATYEGACKHIVATLLFISDYIERNETMKPTNKEEKTIYQILDYFDKQDYINQVKEIFHIKVNISIPSMLRNNQGNAFVSLYAGSSRLYKIQSLKKFLADYINKENIILGKHFKFIHGESKFDKKSKKILDYLLEIYEIQEALGKVYYSNLFTKSQITFTKNMLLKLLDLFDEESFDLELNGKVLENVTCKHQNPPIRYELTVGEDSISIDYNEDTDIIPMTENGELLYMDGIIYMPEKKFIKNYKPFYNNLGKEKSPLIFQGENKHKFLKTILPKINETMEIEIPDDIKDKYITGDLKTLIYLDKYKSGIKAEIRFKYGDYEFNALEYEDTRNVIIVRQPQKEAFIIDIIENLGFVQVKNIYLMKEDLKIYEFLSERIHELTELCELYYSEAFKNIKIKQPSRLSTNLVMKSDSDLLSMEFNYEDIPKEELKDLFHSLKIKKKYYRMKNGNFLYLDNDNLRQAADILEALNLTSKDIQDGSVTISKRNALYLDQYFQSNVEVSLIKDENVTAFVNRILNPSVSNYTLPEGIKTKLRPYQITGFKWLKTLADNGLGGILADDMGLGKTLQAIVYIASCLDEKKPHLVVCPTSLVFNWQDEIHNFAPFLRAEVVTGTPEERHNIINNYEKYDVIITSYPLIRRDSEEYEKIEFHTIFIDEAQYIKNANSLNAKSVKDMTALHRFALTGTPIENSLSELWSIFDFVMPHYLGSHNKFVNRYEKPIVKEKDLKALEDLTKHISPFILRRMKKEVLTELPEKIETKMRTDLTELQRKVYLSYLDQIKAEIGKEIKHNGFEKSQIKILAALTRLRQICCHPSTFIDNYNGGSGKLELLMELIPEAIAGGHRILVFSQFTSMLKIIEAELMKNNIDYFYLEGSTPIDTRGDYVRRFNAGEGSVFLISLKAGGTGLNLTGADTVIHYDPWWNPAVEDQATDRVYRIGQKNSVNVIKLITKGTIEEKIYKLQKSKKDLSDSVVQSKEVFINKLSKEDLEDLFR